MGAFSTINLNDSVPAATSGFSNVSWQSSTSVHDPTIANVSAQVPLLKASGTGHQGGLAPDPGAVAGTSKFLREDATWATPGSSGGGLLYAADSGGVNTLVVAPAIPSLTAGVVIAVKANNTNTSGATIAVDGAGAVALNRDGSALNADDIRAGQLYLLGYDGSVWNILGVLDASYIGGSKVKNGMTLSDGDLLTWVAANSDWENKAPGTLSGFNASKLQGTSISSGTPITGDALRYNEWGDSKWDLCQGAPFVRGWFADLFNASINAFNANTNPTVGTGGALQRISPTATEPASVKNLTAGTGTTSVTCYIAWQSAGNQPFSWGTVRRLSMRVMLLHTANVRYFWGWFSNGATPAVSTGTDTPNLHYAAFRYSAGTDSTIKAVCGTATGTLTVVDTTVAVDTSNSHVFDIAFDGTNVNFFIDGALKAQISTTLPSASDAMQPSLMCDNKNTANAVGWQFAWMVVTPK